MEGLRWKYGLLKQGMIVWLVEKADVEFDKYIRHLMSGIIIILWPNILHRNWRHSLETSIQYYTRIRTLGYEYFALSIPKSLCDNGVNRRLKNYALVNLKYSVW